MSLVDQYYTIQVRVSANHSLTGKLYWQRARNEDDSLHRCDDNDELLKHDYDIALAAWGPHNVRIVKITVEEIKP